MATKMEDELSIDPTISREIADLLNKSQALSENIHRTEQEIQNIANILKQVQARNKYNSSRKKQLRTNIIYDKLVTIYNRNIIP